MGRTLTRTVSVWDGAAYKAFPAGTDESDIPDEALERITNPKAWEAVESATPAGIHESDENGNVPDALSKLTNAQLDKVGLAQDPPIDLANVRKKDDKIEVLRAAGVGNDE